MYPKDVGKYRYVNETMDAELVLYRKEIERRFRRSDMRDYQYPRLAPDPVPQPPPSSGKSKHTGRRKKTEPAIGRGAPTEATIEREGTKHHHASNSNISIKLSKYVQQYGGHNEQPVPSSGVSNAWVSQNNGRGTSESPAQAREISLG